MDEKKFFLVTGLPRSGTSVLAGVLHNLGIDMLNGRSVRLDNKNQTGYFEDLRIVNINMSNTNSRTFNSFIDMINDVVSGHEIKINPDEYYNPIKYKLDSNDLFVGAKDPRLCFPDLLDVFLNILQSYISKSNIKVIFSYRNIFSVLNSLCSIGTYNASIPNLLKLYSDAIIMVRDGGYDYTIVDYDRLVSNPKNEIEKIADFCGVEITKSAINIVRGDLRRY